MATAAERADFKARLEKMEESLDDVRRQAGELMVEREGLYEEMKPLEAAIQMIDYKLNQLNMLNTTLVIQFTKFSKVYERMEEDMNIR